MIEVRGKYGVYARVLKHSISPAGVNLLTFEVSYPRIILAELNTHGMVCKNSSSSRAIPFAKMQENLTGRPIRFGANQAGMQDKGEDYAAPVFVHRELQNAFQTWLVRYRPPTTHHCTWDEDAYGFWTTPEVWWDFAQWIMSGISQMFFESGYHKQVYNRVTESFQMMKTVLSATEWANLFWLRDHGAADPSLHELARCMHEAAKVSTPVELLPGEWHLPYVQSYTIRDRYPGETVYFIEDEKDDRGIRELTLDEAIKVSSARCAAVSFRNVDYDVEKSTEVFAKLTSDLRIHGSAFQHQATALEESRVGVNEPFNPATWQEGVSHVDREGQLWSAQFRGWAMHRKLIPGENKPGFLLDVV
jgi:hypothetical protein